MISMRAVLCSALCCDLMDCSPPDPSVRGILQSRILEWVALFFSRGSSRPPSPELAGGFFTTEPPSVQSLSRVQHLETLWTAACQASLSITNSQSLLKLMSIDSVMPSNHLILRHPLLLLPSTAPTLMKGIRASTY